MESYSAIKQDNLKAPIAKWMQLEVMLMSEMVWAHMGEHCVMS